MLKRRQVKLGPEHPDTAATLFDLGSNLIRRNKFSDAEPLLRECLTIHEKNLRNHWRLPEVRCLLGASLLGQGKYAEAEPLLLAGYSGLKQRETKLPVSSNARLTEAMDRLAQLFDAWGKKNEAAKWRQKSAATGR